jgi:uncharacterized membrane protein
VNLPDALLPQALNWLGYGLFLPLAIDTIRHAPWHQLRDPARLNIWLGAAVCVLLLWQINTEIKPGLSFHLLGATILTLMFGPRLALVALAMALAGAAAWGGGSWQSFGLNGLAVAALPVAVSHAAYRLIDTRLPNNFFVYIFLTCFVGAGAAVSAVGITTTTLLAGAGVYPSGPLFDLYLPYYLLLAWSEALLTGMTMTLLVIYKPDWVETFDDRRYLLGK